MVPDLETMLRMQLPRPAAPGTLEGEVVPRRKKLICPECGQEAKFGRSRLNPFYVLYHHEAKIVSNVFVFREITRSCGVLEMDCGQCSDYECPQEDYDKGNCMIWFKEEMNLRLEKNGSKERF